MAFSNRPCCKQMAAPSRSRSGSSGNWASNWLIFAPASAGCFCSKSAARACSKPSRANGRKALTWKESPNSAAARGSLPVPATTRPATTGPARCVENSRWLAPGRRPLRRACGRPARGPATPPARLRRPLPANLLQNPQGLLRPAGRQPYVHPHQLRRRLRRESLRDLVRQRDGRIALTSGELPEDQRVLGLHLGGVVFDEALEKGRRLVFPRPRFQHRNFLEQQVEIAGIFPLRFAQGPQGLPAVAAAGVVGGQQSGRGRPLAG